MEMEMIEPEFRMKFRMDFHYLDFHYWLRLIEIFMAKKYIRYPPEKLALLRCYGGPDLVFLLEVLPPANRAGVGTFVSLLPFDVYLDATARLDNYFRGERA